MLCGAALSVVGLLLQTAFRNPLAGPSLFGIDAGAALGAALVMLLMGGNLSLGNFNATGYLAILSAAFIGAMSVTMLIFLLSNIVKSTVMLLIMGIMTGYVVSSAISLLNFYATAEGVRSYMMWGMGNFGSVSLSQLPLFVSLIGVGLVAAMLLMKPLNALLLGDFYATNLGINTKQVRNILLVVTGGLVACTTAFCGPIAFIGLAVPHLTRLLAGTENSRELLPLTLLSGSVVALLCNLLCLLPGERGVLPLNAITPLVGAPVIIYVVFTRVRGES